LPENVKKASSFIYIRCSLLPKPVKTMHNVLTIYQYT